MNRRPILVLTSVLILGSACGGGSSDPDAAADAPPSTTAISRSRWPVGKTRSPPHGVPGTSGWKATRRRGVPRATTVPSVAPSPIEIVTSPRTRTTAHGSIVSVAPAWTAMSVVTMCGLSASVQVSSAVTYAACSVPAPVCAAHVGAASTVASGVDGGAIAAAGGGGADLNRNVRAVNVLVNDPPTVGVELTGKAAFSADSRDLTITGSNDRPISVAPPAVQSIPTGTYTGNATDEIWVASDAIQTDEAFHARGVPYRLAGTFTLVPQLTESEGGLATLTIDAGVTIRVPRGAGADNSFQIGNSNAPGPAGNWPVRLIADGTAAPITFTSAEAAPVAGDWAGIDWGGGPATGNVVRNLHVEYAGGNSGTQGFGCGPLDNDAALIIRHWIPAEGTITGSTFLSSAGGGIVSGWLTDAGGPNLKTGNTFTGVAVCEVSRWKNATIVPACPSAGVTPDCL